MTTNVNGYDILDAKVATLTAGKTRLDVEVRDGGDVGLEISAWTNPAGVWPYYQLQTTLILTNAQARALAEAVEHGYGVVETSEARISVSCGEVRIGMHDDVLDYEHLLRPEPERMAEFAGRLQRVLRA